MITNGAFKRDRWVCGVRVVASGVDTANGRFGGTLRVSAGGTLNVTVAPYRFYLYYNPISTAEEIAMNVLYSSLYTALKASFESGAGGTFTVGAYTLPGSSVPKTGLWMNWSGGVWSIDWDNTNMNPEWFGFDRDITGTTTSDSGGTIHSPKSIKYTWVSNSLVNGVASDKEKDSVAMQDDSSERESEAYTVPWGPDDYRTINYNYVPENAAIGELVLSTPDNKISRLAIGDDHAAFWHVWENIKYGADFIVVHNAGDDCGLEVVRHEYEVGKLTKSQRMKSDQLISRMEVGGRFYKISPRYVILRSTYGTR